MHPKLEDGHGEFFASLVREQVSRASLTHPERFTSLVEEMARFIEAQSPVMLIPTTRGGHQLLTYYGSNIPQGYAGLLIVDGRTPTKEGRPRADWACMPFDPEFAAEAGDSLKDYPLEHIMACAPESLGELIRIRDKAEQEYKMGYLIHCLIGRSSEIEGVQRFIRQGFVPAITILLSAEGGLYASVQPVAIAMPDDVAKEVYSEEGTP
jgi:hypothetical protein